MTPELAVGLISLFLGGLCGMAFVIASSIRW